MLCARCKLDKDRQLFSPCMWTKKKSYRVFCRKCVSEERGYNFGKLAGSEIGRKKFGFLTRSIFKENRRKHAQQSAEVKRLLEMRTKRLAEMQSTNGTTPHIVTDHSPETKHTFNPATAQTVEATWNFPQESTTPHNGGGK